MVTVAMLLPYIVCFLVGNGGVDPYSSPYIIPNNSLHNPFPTCRVSWGTKG